MRLSWRPVTAAMALALTACTSAAPHSALASHAAPARPVVSSVGGPGCSSAAAPGRQLPAGLARLSNVPDFPFDVAVTADGRWSFVSFQPGGSGQGGLGVFADAGSAGPRLVRRIMVPAGGLGMTLTPDGRHLLVADGGSGAAVVSVPGAEHGSRNAVLGQLTGGTSARGGSGAIEVAVSRDGRFAFVSLEGSDEIAVFNLQRALASHFHASGFVGDVPTRVAPVGLAVSPDGNWLYSTSEAKSYSELRNAFRSGQRSLTGAPGTLAVISIHKAETEPAHAVVSTLVAGCSPVRVVTSASGQTVWVTARASDMLLGFSASRLRGDPAHSLIARVAVGEAPVRLALVDGGQRVVVADSNRFGQPGARSSLAVVNVPAALAHRPPLAGYLPAGGFPRQMALEPGGRVLLVTDFASQQLETVNVTNLP